MIDAYQTSDNFILYLGDCIEVIKELKVSPSLIFADPPYFLSNNGFTIQSGEIVSVNKGQWDELKNNQTINDFNYNWLKSIREIMPKDGTIWISGTFHNIFSIAQQITDLSLIWKIMVL